jgi:hypothetical protein
MDHRRQQHHAGRHEKLNDDDHAPDLIVARRGRHPGFYVTAGAGSAPGRGLRLR